MATSTLVSIVIICFVSKSSSIVSGHKPKSNYYEKWLEDHTRRAELYGGDWLHMPADRCQDFHVCVDDSTIGNVTWQPSHGRYTPLDKSQACNLMHTKGYNRIYLIGDSFVRHIYQAFLILFSGDFDTGSLNNNKIKGCEGENQFAEKRCSGITSAIRNVRSVCVNGSSSIAIAFLDVFRFRKTPDIFPYMDNKALLIWSEGSHPALFNYSATKDGRNDPEQYKEKFLTTYKICQNRQSKQTLPRNVVWVSTHLRPYPGKYKNETFEDISVYNKGMRDFFSQSKNCGNVKYVDVFNMTQLLQMKPLKRSLRNLTYDGMHFLRTVNLLKAQLIMNDL